MLITLNWLRSIPQRVSLYFMARREQSDECAESELVLITTMDTNPNMSGRSWTSMLTAHYPGDIPFSHKSQRVEAKLLHHFAPADGFFACFSWGEFLLWSLKMWCLSEPNYETVILDIKRSNRHHEDEEVHMLIKHSYKWWNQLNRAADQAGWAAVEDGCFM